MKSFWIHAFQLLAVYLAVAYLFLLAALVWLVWRALCWIATRRQPQPETGPSAAELDEQTLAEVDAELDRRIAQIDLHKREEGRS